MVSKARVCVIGLGTIGYPTALYIKEHGFEVIGCDIKPISIKEFDIYKNPLLADIYVICVDTESVISVCESISKINNRALTIVESTVPVGTCRKIFKDYNLRIAHCPHRYWAENPKEYGVCQLRVLGAINDQVLAEAKKFYDTLGIPTHIVSSLEVAELSKIAENTYRFIQIAFAEELKMVCDDLNLDFNEVRRACNTKWNIEILEARDGIGGKCLPKDTRIFLSLGGTEKKLTEGAIKADAIYKRRLKKCL